MKKIEEEYEKIQPKIFAFFYAKTGNKTVAQDLCHDTFYEACKNITSFKQSAKYISTDDSYRFKVLVENELEVETTYIFDVYNTAPYKVFNDTIHKSRIHKEASQKLNKEAQIYLKKELLKKSSTAKKSEYRC